MHPMQEHKICIFSGRKKKRLHKDMVYSFFCLRLLWFSSKTMDVNNEL